MATEMGSNSAEGEGDQHVVKIWEINKDRLNLMHQKMANPPTILTKSAAKSSCCIFRVPQSFIEINGKSYQPHILSIGPYHHGEPHLMMIEEHKWRYLDSLLSRIQSKGLHLEDLLKAVEALEMKARQCYSETIRFGTDELVEMMVLDGCFIIELFRKVGDVVQVEADDPLFTMQWIITFFYRDLLRLENQIPYFLLECLFDLSSMSAEDESGPSLSTLALNFFNYALHRPEDAIAKHANLKGRHLLDLVRSSYIDVDQTQPPKYDTPSHIIHCVSKLRRAGIQLTQGKEDSFLVVKFKHGVIEMPTITIDDTMRSFLLNCVAYEQCHNGSSKHLTTYATLLDCLVNTYKDVEYLCDHNIIENYFGTDAEVAKFINNLGKEVAFDIDMSYLAELFKDVNQYYKNSWHVQWAGFKYTYFDTPWSFISALAALILLLLTVAQTFYTVYGTYKKEPS
ncbi:UPF0481 protein At3g47200 [Manihot esculenta]|uniref:Uncharacterized protein n=1 Tax=Manihot esculenta TaxID=3983 RepID=A0A2C9VCR7_MANES|nr:UPF0481 protein At3g47200 [Manihot esculenta]OAY42859.1 hypothetical protein MANES_08G021900v8 [Manihot esculenta]